MSAASEAPRNEKRGPTAAAQWLAAWQRIFRVLLRPQRVWAQNLSSDGQTQSKEAPPSVAEIMWPHVGALVLLRAVAEFVGALLSDASFADALKLFAMSAITWFSLLWILAATALTLASARGGKTDFAAAFRFSAYALTPLLFVGMLGVVPIALVAPVADVIAMPYAFFVMSLGVVPELGVPLERAPATVGLFCGLLLALWVLLPGLLRLGLMALTGV